MSGWYYCYDCLWYYDQPHSPKSALLLLGSTLLLKENRTNSPWLRLYSASYTCILYTLMLVSSWCSVLYGDPSISVTLGVFVDGLFSHLSHGFDLLEAVLELRPVVHDCGSVALLGEELSHLFHLLFAFLLAVDSNVGNEWDTSSHGSSST